MKTTKKELLNGLDTFTRAFLACGLQLCDEEIGSKMFNDNSLKSLGKIIDDCNLFLIKARPYLDNQNEDVLDRAGFDFWLTRNGHGTGFWDREEVYGEASAKALTDLCDNFTPCEFYRIPNQRWIDWVTM